MGDGFVFACIIFFLFFCEQLTVYLFFLCDWGADVCFSVLTPMPILASMRYGKFFFFFFFLKENTYHLGCRSEERRVGKEGLRLCGYRWSPHH